MQDIIGDHDEGTLKSKGDKALLRAIEVLESVREEGQDRRAADEVALVRTGSPYAVSPGRVRKDDGTPYRVFTPFHRAWLALLEGGRKSLEPVKSIPVTKEVAPGPIELTTEGILDQAGFRVPARKGPAGGRTAAKERLSRFLSIMAGYGETRDMPGIEGTSRIAMDLRFGFLSAREAAKTATEEGSPGAGKWLSELCWRDFYQEVLRLHDETLTRLERARNWLMEYGFLGLEISIGDTPACSILEEFAGVDEVRPGNFVFYDVMQLSLIHI